MAKRLLIIDMLNLFIRNYTVNPSLDDNGVPVGGVKGTLGSIQKISKEVKPDEIVICWDTAGGSMRRKSQNKNYKSGRRPIKLNRVYEDLDEKAAEQNKINQIVRLTEYLNLMPIIQLSVEGVEADDIISFVSQARQYSDWHKVIYSSDKDFYQLCNKRTFVIRRVKQEYKAITESKLVEEFNIHPNNFALARALVGDKSDNIVGISGVGMKTVAKCFPFLSEDKTYYISDIIEHAKQKLEEGTRTTIYGKIADSEKTIKENYDMMQLYSPLLSVKAVEQVNYALDNFEYDFNQTKFLTMIMKDGISSYKFDDLFRCLNRIIRDNK